VRVCARARVCVCTLVQALRLCTGRRAHRGFRRIALLFHDHGTRRGVRNQRHALARSDSKHSQNTELRVTENTDTQLNGRNIASTAYCTGKVSLRNPMYSRMRPVGQSRRPIIRFLVHTAHHSRLVLWSYMRPQTRCRPFRSTLNVTPTYTTSAYQTSARRHTLENYNEQSSLRSRASNFTLNFNGEFVSVLWFSESHNNLKKNCSSTVKHWSLTFVCIVLNCLFQSSHFAEYSAPPLQKSTG